VSTGSERAGERESLLNARAALPPELPEAPLELPVTKREGAGVALAIAVGEAQPLVAEALPVVGAEVLPVVAAEAGEVARAALEPILVEPAAVVPAATSTSSASLRAVELPPLPDSEPSEWLGAAPLPADELRKPEPSENQVTPERAPVAAKASKSSRGFWIAGAAALAVLLAVLTVPGRNSHTKGAASLNAGPEGRPAATRVETAKLPRTEAELENGPSAASAAPIAEAAPATVTPPVAMAVSTAPSAAEPAVAASPADPAREPAPAAAVGYNQKALEGALHWGIAQAEACHRGGRPTGTARATMTFSPSGKITEFVLEGEPIASAAVGKCVTSYLRSVMIPPFDGSEFTITREITLR
jgi:hypothetical protein